MCCVAVSVQNGAEEPAIPAAGGAPPTTEADIGGSILKTEPESEVEPGSDKWQYVDRPVPEVCVWSVCVCVCVCVCGVCVCVWCVSSACSVPSLTALEKILLYLIGQHWSCDSHSLPL